MFNMFNMRMYVYVYLSLYIYIYIYTHVYILVCNKEDAASLRVWADQTAPPGFHNLEGLITSKGPLGTNGVFKTIIENKTPENRGNNSCP